MIVGAHSFPVTGDGEHNFSTICAAAERAAEAGAELLLFPECALTGYPPRDIPSSAAVDFPRLAEMHAALHKLSDARNLALIVGSMVPAENGVRNAVMIFRPRRGTADLRQAGAVGLGSGQLRFRRCVGRVLLSRLENRCAHLLRSALP